MSIVFDQHMHSYHSGDSKSPMKDMIESGITNGLQGITFTEHLDLDFPPAEETPAGMWDLDVDTYYAEWTRLTEQYEKRCKVRLGIEMGLQEHLATVHKSYAQQYAFDFVIGSMHLLDRVDPYYGACFVGKTDEDVYYRYFEATYENIKAFPDFDSLGHLDYVVRYGKEKDLHYSYEQNKDVIDPILRFLVENGKGLEVNTAGLRYGLRNPNPCVDVIKRYRELGGEIITIGSDAHVTKDIAYGFNTVGDLLLNLGYRYYAVFSGRVPVFEKI